MLQQNPDMQLLLVNVPTDAILSLVPSLLELEYPRDAATIECMKRARVYPYPPLPFAMDCDCPSVMPDGEALRATKGLALVLWNRPSSICASAGEYMKRVASCYEDLELAGSRLCVLEDLDEIQRRNLLPILRFYTVIRLLK